MVYYTLGIFTAVVSTRKSNSQVKLVVGATHILADILAETLTLLSRVMSWGTPEEGISGCYNYRGNELA